jgi:hypothetical protein
MVRGESRPLWWRLWLLAALVPLAAGLIYGIVHAGIQPAR